MILRLAVRVEVTAIAAAGQVGSVGPVHYIKIRDGRLSVQLWRRAEPINRDDRLPLPRAN